MVKMTAIKGYKILDSRNNPTVSCKIALSDGKEVIFRVPSGASTGKKEVLEKRDNSIRWRGKDVNEAIEDINKLAKKFEGREVELYTQDTFDYILEESNRSEHHGKIGGNTILALSGAFALARAASLNIPLWKMFAGERDVYTIPVPQLNVLNAGKHADTGFEVQETMVVPVGAESFTEAMEMATNVWYALKERLKRAGLPTGRGDEGGFVNPFRTIAETAENVLEAIVSAGYKAGKDVWLVFDGAFSEIFGKDLKEKQSDPNDRTYHLGGERLAPGEVVEFWAEVVNKYPVISLEDGMSESDKEGWIALTKTLGDKVQLVLDDYICTNPKEISKAIEDGIGNSSLIKPNQVGTITKTLKAIEITANAKRTNVVSHRSGETEDDLIAHLSLHPSVHQIKSGSSGSERNAKYNTLMMIEQDLGRRGQYLGIKAFHILSKD